MNNLACYGKKLQHLCTNTWRVTKLFISCCYRDILFRANPFLIYISYFLSLSFLGFGILKSLKPRSSFTPRNIDLFFTSVSAATVSSMSTVEMEVFSNSQLIVLTVLMLIGGEIFTSMVGFHLKSFKIVKSEGKVESIESNHSSSLDQIELGGVKVPESVWVLGKKIKKSEAEYLLKNAREAGYVHFLPRLHCVLLVATVMGFVLIGCVLFWSMEWDSVGLSGLNSYQKVVGVIFECVNARHAGETILDLSTVAPPILVFFVLMMYLPPYTSFLPISKSDEKTPRNKKNTAAQNLILSQLSYLVIFIILICITERKSLKEDPLNFSVLDITVEVISAYGNVGFTTGYSCDRRIRPDPSCVNKWFGFAGKWSDEGKVILIIVMFFGRLKKFNMNFGGRAWKLL
ncbi:sodium transporter hkt1 [Phtheirospermum japonicum]|uniref:Sodium transporter hkt1 n=1 Tax=Phtheirospermum japonicum TaxID=374723 RepID=A0A830CFY5_9LAMI|nr:sodium transporter hkt1 [Phtheirospermum japonicum]